MYVLSMRRIPLFVIVLAFCLVGGCCSVFIPPPSVVCFCALEQASGVIGDVWPGRLCDGVRHRQRHSRTHSHNFSSRGWWCDAVEYVAYHIRVDYVSPVARPCFVTARSRLCQEEIWGEVKGCVFVQTRRQAGVGWRMAHGELEPRHALSLGRSICLVEFRSCFFSPSRTLRFETFFHERDPPPRQIRTRLAGPLQQLVHKSAHHRAPTPVNVFNNQSINQSRTHVPCFFFANRTAR